MTLIAAIMIFFIIFTIGYYYIQSNTSLPEASHESLATRREKSVDVLGDTFRENTEQVQPYTQIRLVIEDEHQNTIEDKELDPLSLLGLSEADFKERFIGYELVEFNENRITLKKILPVMEQEFEYALGIQDDWVCIVQKEENLAKRYIPLNMHTAHFSKYTYSLLLKEAIVISALQKDMLINNPNYIEKILQSYEDE